MKYYIGCAGWNYKDWIGPFYPENLSSNKQLHYYSKVFDFTEVNSTYYNLPSESSLKNWQIQVSEQFTFSIKMWRKVSHEIGSPDLESRTQTFFRKLRQFEKKVNFYLIQFPPTYSCNKTNLKRLEKLIDNISTTKPIAFEFRDNSWFQLDNLSDYIDGNKRILVTTYLEGVDPVYLPNQKHYYLRLIGDRSITEFNRVQRTNDQVFEDIQNKIKAIQVNFKLNESAVIAFNNHLTGFAPRDVNEMKKRLGLPIHAFKMQRKLTDFL